MKHLIKIEVDGRHCIGLDVGDRESHFHIEDAYGKEVGTGKVPTSREGMMSVFCTMAAARIALEVGQHSPWLSELLTSQGHEVFVANAYRVALIAKNSKKSDQTDAKFLAWLLRVDPRLLFPIRHRGVKARADLESIRARDLLVRQRTGSINFVRGTVKAFGARIPSEIQPPSFARKARSFLPAALRKTLMPILEMIAHQTSLIQAADREIERLCKEEYPETGRLRQIDRVGAITALSFVLVVDDPTRFHRRRDVGAYLGLVPKRRSSGESDPELSITKAGDRLLRRLLVQVAHQQLSRRGQDSELRCWGLALARRGGKNAKKRAVTAVARKLGVLMLALWVKGENYVPLREEVEAAA